MYDGCWFARGLAGQSTPDFRKTTLGPFVTGLLDTAKIMEEDPFRTLPDPKYYEGHTSKDLQLADDSYASLSSEDRHQMTKTIEESCLQRGGDKVISVEAGEYDERGENFTMTSNGFEAYNETTQYWTGANMTARDEGDRRPSESNWVGCRYRSDLPSLEATGQKAAERTLALLGGKKIQTETIPIIVENRVVSRLLGGLLNPMFAGNIQQQRSYLANKKGEAIGSKLLTIIDDPFIPRGLASGYTDDDGFPTRKRELFTQGVLNDFLVDWYYGKKLGWEPNSGSLTNIIIPPGTKTVDEMIKDLGRCIFITGFIGGNSNTTTGDFSVGVLGQLYDKGSFVQNIAEMNIADNHLTFWKKLVETGNDPWIYSQLQSPSLVFEDVR